MPFLYRSLGCRLDIRGFSDQLRSMIPGLAGLVAMCELRTHLEVMTKTTPWYTMCSSSLRRIMASAMSVTCAAQADEVNEANQHALTCAAKRAAHFSPETRRSTPRRALWPRL